RKAPVYNAVPGELSRNSGSGSYGYEQLNEFEKAAYDALEQRMSSLVASEGFDKDTYTEEDKIYASFEYEISSGEWERYQQYLFAAYTCFTYDHPQYFFLGSEIRVGASGNNVLITMQMAECYYSGESRKATFDAILETAAEWIETIESMDFMADAEISDAKKDYLKAVAVHDLICERIEYAYNDAGDPETAKWAHSIGGVMTGEGAVCEGFAKAFNYMLNLLEVDNVYIVGDAKTASGWGGHAWNAVGIEGSYFYVDCTWDDNGCPEDENNLGWYYYYFGLEADAFTASHRAYTPKNAGLSWMYTLPDVAEDGAYFFYKLFDAFSNAVLDSDSAQELVSRAVTSQHGNYLQVFVSSQSSVNSVGAAIIGVCNVSPSYYQLATGYLFFVWNPNATNPAEGIAVNAEKNAIEIGESIVITAEISPADSDDSIMWTVENDSSVSETAVNSAIVTVVRNGKTITVKGLVDGTVTITATAATGGCKDSVEIKVGTGIWVPQYRIFAAGTKTEKSVTIQPAGIKASSWKDARGKTKAGKLVYVILSEDTGVEFDQDKHTVATKSDKSIATVSTKGVVTAKSAGTAYLYICDTGSMTYEKYPIVVEQAPSKLFITSAANSSEKENIVKTTSLAVGYSQRVYVIPYIKEGTVSEKCNYSAVLAKTSDSKYLSVGSVSADSKGNLSFTVTALSIDTAKAKSVKVKVVVTCVESGKKTAMTVAVTNPVADVGVDIASGDLDKKKDSVKVTLDLSCAQKDIATTDKLKLFVSSGDMTLDGKKVIIDRGATVKAKLAKDGKSFMLTASKDAGTEAKIGLLVTNTVTKKSKLY
ncbi:MAG: hypothetical protein J6X66_13355, partial [Lachnospiraceae bacterium]|nr:hypothetical protein [Lachnospiraceae bacterium]